MKTVMDSSGTTTYKYNLMGSKITYEERTGANACEMYYAYDNTGKLYGFYYDGTSNDGFYYYKRNIQGDIIGIVNSSGTEVTTYVYDAWGKLVSKTGSLASTVGSDNPFRYRGYYYDDETELYYLNQRYYNPRWRRFINADDFMGVTGGLLTHNVFAYCGNNPVMLSDLSGRSATLFGAFFGAIVGGVTAAIKGQSFVAGAIGGAVTGALVGLAIDTCGAAAPIAVTLLTTGAAGFVGGFASSFIKQTGNQVKQGTDIGEAINNFDTDQANKEGAISSVSAMATGGMSYAFEGANNFVKETMEEALMNYRLTSSSQYLDEIAYLTKVQNTVNVWQAKSDIITGAAFPIIDEALSAIGLY